MNNEYSTGKKREMKRKSEGATPGWFHILMEESIPRLTVGATLTLRGISCTGVSPSHLVERDFSTTVCVGFGVARGHSQHFCGFWSHVQG